MKTTELNTTALRAISDEDLGAVVGGFQVYMGGGSGTMAHGKVVGSRPNGNDIIAGFLIAGEVIGVLSLL